MKSDADLFIQAISDVKPLKQNRSAHHHSKSSLTSSAIDYRRKMAQQDKQPQIAYSEEWVEPIEPNQIIQYHVDKNAKKMLQEHIKSHALIQYHLDLHGYNIAQSAQEIEDFLNACLKQHYEFVRIIHGRSYKKKCRIKTLKSYTNYILKQFDHVAAFCSAPKHLGDSGATLVLLDLQSYRNNQ